MKKPLPVSDACFVFRMWSCCVSGKLTVLLTDGSVSVSEHVYEQIKHGSPVAGHVLLFVI